MVLVDTMVTMDIMVIMEQSITEITEQFIMLVMDQSVSAAPTKLAE